MRRNGGIGVTINKSMNICIFGDSIVWGASDYKKGGWAERLKTYLMKSANDVAVYNFGVSGNTTEELLKRFEQEVKARAANTIIFAIGINDSQYLKSQGQAGITLEEFKNNISRLAKMARKLTDKVVFIGLTKVDEPKTRQYSDAHYDNESIQEYDKAIREFCLKNKLKFIEMFETLTPKDLEDGLHPNSEGHQKMFEKVKAAIL